jgi:hypothetical protein
MMRRMLAGVRVCIGSGYTLAGYRIRCRGILLGDRRQAVVQAISHLLLDDDWLHESADIRNG